ncbi:GerAB/ArcD/ProY family transporter [Paenibacillus xylanilyticus]|uniref:GerAB/ArcD/ProY family transporter n=1 Tax=Paenibacillus xylanilyticus TaxID=248903 RepID=A0A7Y6BZX9_9BACL|nr:GerAB/ArcD/ProY family transporter [Paenibacillus xylanilyticus]NUU77596.1 GerAB/ArcD/ProY family transporter [Paenibacillus xylanilyticus]
MNTSGNRYSMSPIHLFFVLYVSLVGVGLMNFQYKMLRGAEKDGWISILAAAVIISIIMKMMFVLLSRQSPDQSSLVHINQRYWGRFAGSILNWIFIVYFMLGSFVAFRSYIHVIQLWILPTQNNWLLGMVVLVLIYYCVSGGIQSVSGMCLWGTLFILVFVFPQTFLVSSYLHPRNLLPVLDHNVASLWLSTQDMLHEFIGCGILLVVYPFIKTPGRSVKWAYGAVVTATIVYLIFFIYSFMYFSHGQMKEHLWPTLSLISIIEMPLIQRMEYLVLSFWLLKILSIITLGLWAACHCLKLDRSIKPSLGLKFAMVIFAVLLFVIRDTVDIDRVTELYTRMGEILILIYVPLVFLFSLVRKDLGDHTGNQDMSDPHKGEGA